MITYQQLYTRAVDVVGVSLTTNVQELTNIQMDINQGLRLFKNAARRYWSRQEKSTPIVNNQQYYQLPPDCVRVTEVRVVSGTLSLPVSQVDSEMMWNKLNVIPAVTINMPTYYFIRGYGEVGLWPVPSTNNVVTLVISYEARLVDMSLNDVTSTSNTYTAVNPLTPVTATVTNGSTAVTLSQGIVQQNMVGQWFQVNDGSDGNWYQIGTYVSSTAFTLVNDYQGLSGSNHTFQIGQAPDIPEDYHLGLVYYAAYQYYLKRSDNASALMYKSLFEDLLNQYRESYAAKTTGQVQNDIGDVAYNLFWVPPNPIT